MEVLFNNRSDSLKNGYNIDTHASTAGLDEHSTQQLEQVYGGMAEVLEPFMWFFQGFGAGFGAAAGKAAFNRTFPPKE